MEAQATYVLLRDGEFVSEASVTSSPGRNAPMLAIERDPQAQLDMGIATLNPGEVPLEAVVKILKQDQTELASRILNLQAGSKDLSS